MRVWSSGVQPRTRLRHHPVSRRHPRRQLRLRLLFQRPPRSPSPALPRVPEKTATTGAGSVSAWTLLCAKEPMRPTRSRSFRKRWPAKRGPPERRFRYCGNGYRMHARWDGISRRPSRSCPKPGSRRRRLMRLREWSRPTSSASTASCSTGVATKGAFRVNSPLGALGLPGRLWIGSIRPAEAKGNCKPMATASQGHLLKACWRPVLNLYGN